MRKKIEKNSKKRKRIVRTPEAARIMNRAKGTMDNDRIRGRGPKYIKIGSAIYYDVDDLYQFIEEHKIDPGEKLKI
jgi:hypothetical protein